MASWWQRKRRRECEVVEGLCSGLDPEEILGSAYEDRYCSRCGSHAKVWRGNDPESQVPWTCGACGEHNYLELPDDA